MIKKIDLYIIRKFLVTFFFSILLFIAISIVIDITEKIDDFIESQLSIWLIISKYYVSFIPYIGAMLSPLFIFIAVIFFTSKMAYNSEIIAILSSGVSFYRMLVPYIATAIFLVLMLLYMNHFLVPIANKQRISFENQYLRTHFKTYFKNVHLQTDSTTYIYMENFNSRDTAGYKFTVEKIKGDKLYFKANAKKIKWHSKSLKWTLQDYIVREIDSMETEYKSGKELLMDLKFAPEDLSKEIQAKDEMTYFELNEFIDQELMRGAENVEFYLIEKYKRTSSPFSVLILTLIGATIASRKVRGGMGFHIAAGIAISALYIVILQFSSTFSTNANLPPIWGVWIPNIIFGVFAIFLLARSPK